MNWQKVSYHVQVSDAGYYIVASKANRRWFYNAWQGKHDDREFRVHVSAGFDLAEVKKACEEHAKRGQA